VAGDVTGTLGNAYFSRFRDRSGDRFTAEDGVYARENVRSQGVGKVRVAQQVELATRPSFRRMITVIGDSAKVGSVGVHASVGFRPAGIPHAARLKFVQCPDVVCMQRRAASTRLRQRGRPRVMQQAPSDCAVIRRRVHLLLMHARYHPAHALHRFPRRFFRQRGTGRFRPGPASTSRRRPDAADGAASSVVGPRLARDTIVRSHPAARFAARPVGLTGFPVAVQAGAVQPLGVRRGMSGRLGTTDLSQPTCPGVGRVPACRAL
jgi:hypothetical protein